MKTDKNIKTIVIAGSILLVISIGVLVYSLALLYVGLKHKHTICVAKDLTSNYYYCMIDPKVLK